MKDILNNKKMLYIGICVLIIGLAFAIGTYAYYSSTITGTATGQILAYTCTSNNTTSFNINDLTNMYPGYSATRTINLDASLYTNATIEVTSYTNMGTSGSSHPNLAIYNDENHQNKMSAGTNVINATITPGTTTSVPLYIYWPYSGEDTYSSDVPSASITITCNQSVLLEGQERFDAYFQNVTISAGAKRYTGANPDNYVSFNDGELWRIIGIYGNQLKIVRDLSIGDRMYDSGSRTSWSMSSLHSYLNGETQENYYYSLSESAKSMIVPGTWNIGFGLPNDNASTAYTNSQATQVENEKVGLIATYEFLYAADSSCHNVAGDTSSFDAAGCNEKDWLKQSPDGWTLNKWSLSDAYVLTTSTHIVAGSLNEEKPTRPAVYLNSNVRISGGLGTEQQPYTLSLN